jgi:FkbM family methyltransferase
MFHFEEVVVPPAMHLVDIGAMLVGEEDPFARLSGRGLLSVTGFEPIPDECNKLNQRATPGRKYLPYIIGDGRRREFYVTNTGMTSSLFEPDLELAARFNNLAELNQVAFVQKVSTSRLDDVAELRSLPCDILKVDVQGAEAMILTFAKRVLKESVIVQTEVEFVPLYKGQALFADVDQLLRKSGFMFHRFWTLSGRTYKPLLMNNDLNAVMSQHLWADAVYVPDFQRLARMPSDALLKLAALLHEIYGSFDFCHVALSEHDARFGTSHAANYLALLARTQ